MANNTIRINPERVKAAGGAIQDAGNKMYTALEDIRGIVDGTKKCLVSDGGDEARRNFNSSAAKFDDFKKFVREYGEFLKSYSGVQGEVDGKIAELARKIPKLN